MSYSLDHILIRQQNRARNLLAIDEVDHYLKCDGPARAYSFYLAFFDGCLDWKTESRLVKAIMTNNRASLQNICKDIQKDAWKTIHNIYDRFDARGN